MTMIAEFTEYITPDGLVFRFDDLDKFLISEVGFGMPPINYITQKGPFQHGETLIDFRLGVRVIQMIYRENSCDRFSYWLSRNNLINFMRPNRRYQGTFGTGILRKWLPDGTKRDIRVVIEFGPSFDYPTDVWDMWGFTETLRFIAHDPIFFDPVAVVADWTVGASTSNLVFPFVGPFVFGDILYEEKTITYPGTWESYPVFQLTGPLNGVIITNLATGFKIRLNYTITVGEVVTVTLDYGNKSIQSNVMGNLIGILSDDSNLVDFSIVTVPEAPLGINTISAYSEDIIIGTSKIRMTYYKRYIGF